MADLDPELVNQILGSSAMGQQEARLQAQTALAAKLREHMLTPQRYASPGAALGGLVSNIIGGVGMDRYRDQINQGQADLMSQQRRLHGAAMGALQGLPSPDPALSPTTGNYEVPVEAVAKRRALGNALAMTDDPKLSVLGTNLAKEADTLQKSSEDRVLKRALGMVELSPGVWMPKSTVETGAKNQNKTEVTPQWTPVPALGVEVNTRTGEHRPLPTSGRVPPKEAPGPDIAKVDPQFLHFVDKVTPETASSRSTLGAASGIMRQVAVSGAIYVPGRPLTPQQIKEIGVGIARIASGGTPAQLRVIEDISANSLGIDLTRLQQFLSGKPTDTKAKEWAEHFMAVLDRENNTAKGAVRGAVSKYAAGYGAVLRKPNNYEEAKKFAAQLGIEPDELDKLIGKDAPAASAMPEPKTEEEYKSIPKGTTYKHPTKGIVVKE